MRLRSKVLACAAIVIIAGGATTWIVLGNGSSSAAAATVSATVAATTSTLEETVSGSGTLTPTVDEEVNFAASGNVTAVKVVAGQTVTKGEVLATLDTYTEAANLLSAKATLASAEATLSNSESSSSGSAADVAQVAADQAAVTVAAAAVTTAQTEYNGTTLTAPVSGMVTSVGVAVGDVSTAGSSSSSGGSAGGSSSSSSSASSSSVTGSSASTSTSTTSTADFEIVGTNSWEVSVSLSASDLANVKVNQQVELSTDDNSAFFGTVKSIGLLPSTTSGAATYPVIVSVTGSPKDLYDGVTVTADIVYKRYSNVITVPSAAVTTSNGTSTVQKVVNGKTVKTSVTVGVTVDNKTQITKGLASGDEVSEVIFTPSKTSTGTTGTTGGTGTFPGGGTGTGTFPGGGTGTGTGTGGFGGGTRTGTNNG